MDKFIILIVFLSTQVFGSITSPPTSKEKEYITRNNFTNPGFESNFSGWCEGSAAAASAPTTDQSCGTSDLTVDRTTTSPITGSFSLEIAKPASNEQGAFVMAYDVVLDRDQRSKSNTLSFSYESSDMVWGSTDGVTPSDIKVFIADRTTSQVFAPFPNTLDGSGQYKGMWQATENTQYQVILWVATTNAVAWTAKFDKFKNDLSEWVVINSDSDWIGFTPTGSWSTNTTYSGRWRKEGQHAVLRYKLTLAGAPTSATLTVNLPSGIQIDTSQLPSIADYAVFPSTGRALDTGVNSWTVFANYHSAQGTTAVRLTHSENYSPLTQSAPATFGNTDTIEVEFRIPVLGWTTGTATPGSVLQRVPSVLFANKANGAISANTTIPTWTTVLKDSVGAFNASTGVYTVKYTGDYFVNVQLTMGSSSTTAQIRKNGNIVSAFNSGASGTRKFSTAFLPGLVVGDTITVSNSGADTIGSTAEETSLFIGLWNDPSSFVTINKVTTKYLSANVTATTNPVTSLSFSGLIVGKKYKIEFASLVDHVTSCIAEWNALHNGSSVMKSYAASLNGSTTPQANYGYFTATTSTLTFSFTETGTCIAYGDGTVTAFTKATLTELNNTFDGSN